jgi:hypothetical protein
MERKRSAVAVALAAACLAGCAPGTGETTPGQKTPASEAAVPSPGARKNACALFDRADIEAIAGQKLEMLHDIQAENKTVCELRVPGNLTVQVSVTVHWAGGKELARINQAAMSMAKQVLNDRNTDIEELTGTDKVRGLADKAFYSDVMPSWVLKYDVLIEILSPQFSPDKTKAVFLAVSRKALSRL